MPPPSQELDARFAVFLNPIRDLTKNWEVDIAKYLEDYLVELSEVQITFDDGRTVMNFAEAAMLIQGSATVYSKKVEFLWQMVLQMIDLLATKKTVKDDQNTKDGPKSRASRQNTTIDFERVDDLAVGKNIYLKEEEEDIEEKPFKLLPSVPLHLVEKESEKSVMRVPLYIKSIEAIGNRDDFRVNRCYITHDGILSLDAPLEKPPATPDENLEKSLLGFNVSTFSSLSQKNNPPEDDDPIDFDDVCMAVDEVEPPDAGVVADAIPSDAVVDNADNIALVERNEDEPSANITEEKRHGLRKRGEVVEHIAEINLKDKLKPMDPHADTPAKRPVRAGRIRKPLPCNCHREPAKTTSRLRAKAMKENDMKKDCIPVEQFLNNQITDFVVNKNNNKLDAKLPFPIDPKLVQEGAVQEAKRSEALKDKKVGEILSSRGANKGISEQDAKERAAEEVILTVEHENRIADDIPDEIPDIDFNDVDDQISVPEPRGGRSTPFDNVRDYEVSNRNLNDSNFYEPSSEYESLVQKWVSEYVNKAQEHVNSSELSRRVNRWRKIIGPIIAVEEKRKGFDIHLYGTEVLSHFAEAGSGGTTVSFGDIVTGLDSREVSRSFLSCLMLANTRNIEIVATPPLSMDCLEISLISKVRHHEKIEEDFTGSPSRRRRRSKRKSVSPCGSDEGVVVDTSDVPETAVVAVKSRGKQPKKSKR